MKKHNAIYKFFDHLEDQIRHSLSHHPFVYTFVGGVGIVLFWRGVWVIADEIPIIQNGWVSLVVSVIIMLSSGLFVSFFVGDNILISGLRGERKLIEKTEDEIKKEFAVEQLEAEEIQIHINKIERILHELKKSIDKKK